MFISRLTICAVLLLAAQAATAAPADNAIERLQSFLHNVHSLKADFTQTVQNAMLKSAKGSHGTVLIKRPNRFRWNYLSPNKEVIDSDGKQIWIYDPGLEQVTVKPLKTTLASSPAMLLSGRGSLKDAFEMTALPRHGGLDWVLLKPKSADSAFKDIRIGLGQRNLQVMELTDNMGQATRIEFSNVARNPEIPDATFKFTPPAGADVIGAPTHSSSLSP